MSSYFPDFFVDLVFPLLGVSLLALLPVLIWLVFFLRKQPEKKTYVALTFLAGMLSVIPIKLYQKYWDVALLSLENLDLTRAIGELVDFPSFPKLFAFVTTNIIVAFGLFLFVAFMMFFLEILSGDNTVSTFKKKFKRILEEPVFFVTVGIIVGVYAYFSSHSIDERIYFFLVVGMLEEFVKNLVVRFSDEFKIRSIDDALEFSIIVALGFAFVENILYFQDALESLRKGVIELGGFFSIVFLRSTLSVAAHIIFSSIFGYFYGVAHFSSQIYKNSVRSTQYFIIKKLHQILHMKEETLFHEEQLFLGMFTAMGLHAIFNSLLEFGEFRWSVAFVFTFLFIIIHLFHRQKHATIAEQETYPLK